MDLIDEVRKKTCIEMAAYQHKIAHHFNAKVRGKTFKAGHLVLCQAEVSQSSQRKTFTKLGGLYQVEEVVQLATNRLK